MLGKREDWETIRGPEGYDDLVRTRTPDGWLVAWGKKATFQIKDPEHVWLVVPEKAPLLSRSESMDLLSIAGKAERAWKAWTTYTNDTFVAGPMRELKEALDRFNAPDLGC